MSTIIELDEQPTGEVEIDKSVEFKASDAEEQIAYGAVLVPDRVDHQGDFFRAETISDLAHDFDERVESSDALPGVMHAVFPTDHIELAENRITEEDIELGDRDLPAGSWVQGWKFTDDELWSLVEDGILAGYSIGGTVDGRIHYDGGSHPDGVTFPDEVRSEFPDDMDPEDTFISEIASGRILEVSAVDMPAVPDATHEEYKSVEKGSPELTDSVVSARVYLENRGHTEEEARRLAEYLNSQKSAESKGWIARAKEFFTSGGGGGSDDGTGQSTQEDTETSKSGRTLSAQNIDSVRAVHDAALDLLGRSDVDHGRQRFSDDPTVDFHVGDYGAETEQSKSDEPAESGTDSEIESMDKSELKELIGEVVDEKMADETEEQTEEKSTDDSDASDLDEIKAQIAELKESVEGDSEEKSDDSNDDVAEIKEMLSEMADAQGISQQSDSSSNAAEKAGTWGSSPFAAGGD